MSRKLRFADLEAVSTITFGCMGLLQAVFSLPISEGLDMGDRVGLQAF
jgi:hypothetical protein